MKRIKHDLSHITNQFFPDVPVCYINRGYCYYWVYIAKILYPQGELFTLYTYGGHAFIKIGDLFYDSDSPKGVRSWKRLKVLKNTPPLDETMLHRQTLKEFAKWWGIRTRSINSKIARVLQYGPEEFYRRQWWFLPPEYRF